MVEINRHFQVDHWNKEFKLSDKNSKILQVLFLFSLFFID